MERMQHGTRRPRVVVGMSGGVDSSVAAALLVEQGYDVIGITIKTYSYEDVGGNATNESSCCSLDGINDARTVCLDLGIPHYVVDFSRPFRAQVIDRFTAAYLAGDTPNPCVLCNRTIKWEELIRKGVALGAEYVAMGHYARVGHDAVTGRYWVTRGVDAGKDQSYALWALSQESLARTLFPLGEISKDDARRVAERLGLHTARKRESYEICFIPDNDYTRFLRDEVPELDARVKGGDVLFEGRKIGEHDGYPFYTIGQRRGLHVAVGEPVFVTEIDAGRNTISVGRKDDLLRRRCVVHEVTMQKHALPDVPLRVHAKIRYKDAGAPATLHPLPDGRVELIFDQPRRAITRGQSTVWYDGDDVVGGGIIASVS
ncbi:MAG: tRNA 2-thiouridine(34) synthase MnmA [Bacteroidota bacterium]|jgi:tRNA-specific 2-thiouridylase|nr:tRNA 2-thiouridine(34) synthase MnmA [Bacteroidota bacterium]